MKTVWAARSAVGTGTGGGATGETACGGICAAAASAKSRAEARQENRRMFLMVVLRKQGFDFSVEARDRVTAEIVSRGLSSEAIVPLVWARSISDAQKDRLAEGGVGGGGVGGEN